MELNKAQHGLTICGSRLNDLRIAACDSQCDVKSSRPFQAAPSISPAQIVGTAIGSSLSWPPWLIDRLSD